MALGRTQKVLIVAGFLATGSINTLTKKWQFQSCGATTHAVSPDDEKSCPPGQKQFHKPWTQNIQMFIGESFMLLLFCTRAKSRARAREQQPGTTQQAPFYIFLLPACCDILGTGVGGVGMLFISASVWQMMRGSLLIFASFLTPVFLRNPDGTRRRLQPFNWVAVLVVAFGLLLVGMSAILDDAGSNKDVPLGIILTIVSQMFAATQMVVEELFVKGHSAPPEQVVGSEGAWGIFMMCIILAVMYFVPGNDAGSYENVVDSVHMLVDESGQLLAFVVLYLISISFFNFLGVTIAGQLSAVTRTINDAMRTMIIWIVEVFVFYCVSEKFGQKWTTHSYLQLIGFVFLIAGNMINSKVLKLPCLTYEEPAQNRTCETQTTVQPNLSYSDRRLTQGEFPSSGPKTPLVENAAAGTV
jgi:energy-converting hydrogenase Eha subunit A